MAALWAVLLALYVPPRTTHLGVLSPNLPTRTAPPNPNHPALIVNKGFSATVLYGCYKKYG